MLSLTVSLFSQSRSAGMLYVGPTCVDPKRKKTVDDKDRVVAVVSVGDEN